MIQRKISAAWIEQDQGGWGRALPQINQGNSQDNFRSKSTKDILNEEQKRVPLKPKIGSLEMFLKAKSEAKTKQSEKELKRRYISMTEAMDKYQKSYVRPTFNDQEKAFNQDDPRYNLLNDPIPYNRQRAAEILVEDAMQEVQVSRFPLINQKMNEIDVGKYFGQMTKAQIKSMTSICNNLEEKLGFLQQKQFEFYNKKVQNIPSEKETEVQSAQSEESQQVTEESIDQQQTKKQVKFQDTPDKLFENKMGQFPQQVFMDEVLIRQFPNLKALDHKLHETGVETIVQIIMNMAQSVAPIERRTQIKSPKITSERQIVTFSKHKIKFVMCQFDDISCYFIAKHFNSFSFLEEVDLSQNESIGDLAGMAFCFTLLQFAKNLMSLNLCFTGISDQTCMAIQQMLKNNTLRVLKIGGNNLKDRACCQLAVGLLYNESVNTLDLSDNMLGMAAGVSLGKVLRVHRKLRNLNLSGNHFGLKALNEICRGVTINRSVRNLQLMNCNIDDEQIRDFTKCLIINKKLTQLQLQNNKISSKGLQYLASGLIKNKRLIHLALSGNDQIDKKQLDKIAQMHDQMQVEICKEDDFQRSKEAHADIMKLLVN